MKCVCVVFTSLVLLANISKCLISVTHSTVAKKMARLTLLTYDQFHEKEAINPFKGRVCVFFFCNFYFYFWTISQRHKAKDDNNQLATALTRPVFLPSVKRTRDFTSIQVKLI